MVGRLPFFGGLGYFNIAVKLVKVLLPRQGMIVSKRLAEFENMDVAAMVCANPDLKRIYDQGPKYVPLGVSSSGAEEGSNSSWDSEDSASTIHPGSTFANVMGASPPPDD
ncbi:hypothetical protein SLA2020_416540 [Shorea laevis]